MPEVLFESNLKGLPLSHRGKVRDVYDADARHLLIVTTDRLSAFDVVLPTPIPGKGALLTRLSNFWFARTRGIIPNHLADLPLDTVLKDPAERRGRRAARSWCTSSRRCRSRPSCAATSSAAAGRNTGKAARSAASAAGGAAGSRPSATADLHALDQGRRRPATTRTSASTRPPNCSGASWRNACSDASLAIYKDAAAYALTRGIIIADTKFEFGLDDNGTLTLIDEVLTPDSSRFWPADTYRPGRKPAELRQAVRARLARIHRLEQEAAGPRASARGRGQDRGVRFLWRKQEGMAEWDWRDRRRGHEHRFMGYKIQTDEVSG